VRLTPAIRLAMAEVEPREKRAPRKREMPLNAGDPEPGMNG
jgi:hypothetical protein